MSALPIDDNPNLAGPAHEAQAGQVVYLTEAGQPIAEVLPAGSAKQLQDADDLRHVLEGINSPVRIRFESAEEMYRAAGLA